MHTRLHLSQNTISHNPIPKAIPLLLGSVLLLGNAPCEARVYRCTDASGNVSYSQTPCPADQTGAKVRGVNTAAATNPEACTHVRNFAAETFRKLKNGREPGMLIDEYGGPGYISPVTLNVINFVSGFRFNTDISSLKIGAMTYNKCTNRGFGKIQTSELPPEILPNQDQMQELPPSMLFPSQSTPGTAPYNPQSAANSNWQQLCQNYAQQLHNINLAVQSGYDAESGQRMRQQYQELLRQHCRQ